MVLIRARHGEWELKQHREGCRAKVKGKDGTGVRHQNTRSHPCLGQGTVRIWDGNIFTVKSRRWVLVRWGGQPTALPAVEGGAV